MADEKSRAEPAASSEKERQHDHIASSAVNRTAWKYRGKPAPPPPASLDDAPEIPLATANFLSQLTFSWFSPILRLGFKRPLEDTDLWKMDHSRQSTYLTDQLEANIAKRKQRAAEWNEKLDNGSVSPSLHKRVYWSLRACRPLPERMEPYGPTSSHNERRATLEAEWRALSGRRVASLTWALADTFPQFWLFGIYKVIYDIATVLKPLLIKAIIEYNQQGVFDVQRNGAPRPSVGKGVALSIGTFLLGLLFSVCVAQFQFQGKQMGARVRAALIGAIYRQASWLTPNARARYPNGTLLTFLSSDVSRIEASVLFIHSLWTAPLQCVAILILVCLQINSAGVIGFLLFLLLVPVQVWAMKFGIKLRNASVIWTEERTKLLQELLSAMGITKMFTYELPYLKRLDDIRRKETARIRGLLFSRAGNFALANSLPTFAAVLAFIAYSAFHPNMNPAILFTALAYFNALRGPLHLLPRAVSLTGDALTALHRLGAFFEAPRREQGVSIDPDLDVAIKESKDNRKDRVQNAKAQGEAGQPSQDEPTTTVQEPFAIRNFSLLVPRGQLVAIVGPVGSGKTSILCALLGEMRLTTGSVEFGGKVGYCQQSAWIQNATIRDNIVFGQDWNEAHYWRCVKQASLVRDLELFSNGDLTEIGERGINLSGGQKQRISIARALYFNPDIYLLDDPLSAVDAHVGRALFNDAILALRNAGKTVVLVTHGLHMLPNVDYIYTVNNGEIVEQGTHAALMEANGPFRLLMDEFGGGTQEQPDADACSNVKQEVIEGADIADAKGCTADNVDTDGTPAEASDNEKSRLIVDEERKTGAVGLATYAHYFRAGNAAWLIPVTLCAVLYQGSQLMSTVWLTYWSEDKFHREASFYQGMYAVLGIFSGIFCFLMGMFFIVLCINICKKMYSLATERVFFSPMSFFETQPLGRIMGIFGKDFEALDNMIPDILIQTLLAVSMFIGAVIIITIHLPFFIGIVFGVAVLYYLVAYYYRSTSRELNRLNANLRSLLYAHFSESLTGLPTIRAYRESKRFIAGNAYRLDLENRANILAKADQSWLELRLDVIAQALTFAVTLACTVGAGKLSPGQVGLSLTYLNQTTQSLAAIVLIATWIENSMNSVERIMFYSGDNLKQEAPYKVEGSAPSRWPSAGGIELDNVVMSYRPGLPPVLKGISLAIAPGERVGIVGRTGAGKTSITVAMYRLAEITSGAIKIDGVNIATLGLQTLRSAIAIIPQDPVLFSGTLRTNLDPFGLYDDETLNHALRRAHLNNEQEAEADTSTRLPQQFTLDMTIDDGGSNLSLGQRSLVSLARALVKDARILVLDEATASVDLETDALIQEAIRSEAQQGRTLLCIAHRLRTVIGWDKILVMDAGEVHAFDSPLNLFDFDPLFNSMCEGSNITREEVARVAKEERISAHIAQASE